MDKNQPYMEFYYGKKSESAKMPKQPYMERYCKNKELANIERAKSTTPVALDTNKTRRKNTLLPLPNAIKKKTAKEVGAPEKVRIPK